MGVDNRIFDTIEIVQAGSPITPPELEPTRAATAERPQIKRRSTHVRKHSRNDRLLGQSSSDEDPLSLSPSPSARNYRQSAKHALSPASSATLETSGSRSPSYENSYRRADQGIPTSTSRTSSTTGTQPIRRTLFDLKKKEDHQILSEPYLDISSSVANQDSDLQASNSPAIVISTQPVSQGGRSYTVPESDSNDDDDDDNNIVNQSSSSSEAHLRPTFLPYQSHRTTPRRPKTSRSINFLILACLKKASLKPRKKKKTTLDAALGGIYIFSAHVHCPGHLKVGKTYRDPAKRREEWEKCKVPLIEVEDLNADPFNHYDVVETLLQAELWNARRQYKCTACKKTHNEWFETDTATVLKVITRWRTWLVREEPFDEELKLTPYWQWKVALAKKEATSVNWDDWVQSSAWERFYHDCYLPWKPHFMRKDERFWGRGVVFVLLLGKLYGWKCLILMVMALVVL